MKDKLQVKHKEESNEQLTGGNIRSNERVVQKRGSSNIYRAYNSEKQIATTVQPKECSVGILSGGQGIESPEYSR
jgi:hypothetical protein